MNSILNPYISFKGNAREAMDFYHSVFGGELNRMTFKEGMPQGAGEGEDDLIMHSMLTAENGIVLMCADTPKSIPYEGGARISISLSGENEEELTGYYNKLSVGGKIAEPLSKAPWGDTFGMFTDKFGIHWMVNITAPKQ